MNVMIKMVRRGGAAWASAIAFLAGIGVASAQGGTQAIKLVDPLGGNESFATVATAVASFLFWDIALPLCTIMVLVGAFKLMTSAGDPEKVSEGRKTILYAAIGFVIALLAGSVTNIIKNFIGA